MHPVGLALEKVIRDVDVNAAIFYKSIQVPGYSDGAANRTDMYKTEREPR